MDNSQLSMETGSLQRAAQPLVLITRAIQKGVRWLKEHSDLLADTRDIAITISALIKAERNPHSHLTERLISTLIQKQAPNGSWSDELWDTVWAVRALCDTGRFVGTDRTVDAAFRFFEATQDPFTGTWYEEPFETMLILDLVARTRPDLLQKFTTRPIMWLASLQNRNGSIVGIRYTGMGASLFTLLCRLQHADESVARNALNHICEALSEKLIWTAAAWSNYYPLKALLDAGYGLQNEAVVKAVEWFLAAQDADGKWMQVSQVHDTAMAVMALSELLSVPIVDVSTAKTGVLQANKENGTIRVSFHGPGAGAITPAEKMKISDGVRVELSYNQQLVVAALGRVRAKVTSELVPKQSGGTSVELERAGRYAYGHLIPARIQLLLETSSADHLRLDIDERLIDLPWELVHDGIDFLCVRYALGRRLVSDNTFTAPQRELRDPQSTRVLVVADPTGDLPAAKDEGTRIATLLREQCRMDVAEFSARDMRKKDFLLSLQDYDIIHFAGHASHDPNSPDESCLVFPDGEIQAFEIARFIANRSPAVVFLNACWSAEELRNPESYSPMMRGLGRTFLYAGVTAFLGYLVPVPDSSATEFAVVFYGCLAQGQTIGESLRRARIACRNPRIPDDLTWCSAILYGDPSARAVGGNSA